MRRRGAIFLDRDGVINEEVGDYVTSWEKFIFRPRIFDILKLLKERKIKVFIVTNQSAIGRKLMTIDDLEDIHVKMLDEIEKNEGEIEQIYCCPHLKENRCYCRKPSIGMIKAAVEEYDVSLLHSIMIGDGSSDIVAGYNAGCRTMLTITDRSLKYGTVIGPNFIAKDMNIVYEILEKETRKW